MPHELEKIFNRICDAAIRKDSSDLNQILEDQLACINTRFNGYVPVMKLAKDGQVDAVNFLIHQYNACIDSAVRGYGEGGYLKELTLWLSRGANLYYAIEGFAYYAGNDDVISRFTPFDYTATLERIRSNTHSPQDIKNCEQYLLHLATGYAFGNHIEAVKGLFATVSAFCQNRPEIISTVKSNALFGFAKGNHKNAIAQLEDITYLSVLEGAAEAGHSNAVINKLTSLPQEGRLFGKEFLEWKVAVARKFALNGNKNAIDRLDHNLWCQPTIVYRYAYGGHIQLVNQALLQVYKRCEQELATAAHVNDEITYDYFSAFKACLGKMLNGYIDGKHFSTLALYLPKSDATHHSIFYHDNKDEATRVLTSEIKIFGKVELVVHKKNGETLTCSSVDSLYNKYKPNCLILDNINAESHLAIAYERSSPEKHIDLKSLHRQLTFLNQPYIIRSLVQYYFRSKKLNKNENNILNLGRLMSQKNMSYDWAIVWCNLKTRIWFLQWKQFFSKKQQENEEHPTKKSYIGLNLWIYISTFLTGFSETETWAFLTRTCPTPKATTLFTGEYPLFKREQALLEGDNEHTIPVLSISKTSLEECLMKSQEFDYSKLNTVSRLFAKQSARRMVNSLTKISNDNDDDEVRVDKISPVLRGSIFQFNNEGVVNQETHIVELLSESLGSKYLTSPR